MKIKAKLIIFICVCSISFGCTHIIEPSDVERISKKTEEETWDRSWYANHWYYIGSDDEFDYLVHQVVAGKCHDYAIQKGQIKVPNRFPKTKDHSLWLSYNISNNRLPDSRLYPRWEDVGNGIIEYYFPDEKTVR